LKAGFEILPVFAANLRRIFVKFEVSARLGSMAEKGGRTHLLCAPARHNCAAHPSMPAWVLLNRPFTMGD
jgi:hypothetical protein